jgi:hypothetical protein
MGGGFFNPLKGLHSNSPRWSVFAACPELVEVEPGVNGQKTSPTLKGSNLPVVSPPNLWFLLVAALLSQEFCVFCGSKIKILNRGTHGIRGRARMGIRATWNLAEKKEVDE